MPGKVERRGWAVAGICVLLAALGVINAPVVLAANEKVSSDHDADWHMRHTSCGGNPTGDQAFMAGPVGTPGDEAEGDLPGDSLTGGPPGFDAESQSTGSLRFRTGADGDSLEEFRNTRYSLRLLSQLQQLIYWTYVQSVPVPLGDHTPAVYLGLEVDTNNDNVADDTLVFEPDYQQIDDDGDGSAADPEHFPEGADNQHEVTPGTWQMWTAKDFDSGTPEGLWYRRSNMQNGQPVFRSIEGWVQTISGLKIVNPTIPGVDPLHAGGVFLAAGCGGDTWDAFTGYADAVSITFPNDPSLFDMEPQPATAATRLDCEPEDDVNPTGKSHLITCTARNAEGQRVGGVEIDAEATGANDNDDSPTDPDFGCETVPDNPATPSIDEGGTCSFRHGPGARGTTLLPGFTEYRAWIDEDDNDASVEADRQEGVDERTQAGSRPEGQQGEGDDTDVVRKRWAPLLNCEPETVTLAPGSTHTITCTVRDSASNAIPDVNIDIELSGVNDTETPASPFSFSSPDLTCTTDAQGNCSVLHGPGPGGKGTTNSTGRTTYRAWIDHDKSDASFDPDTSEGRSESGTPGSVSEPDYTDVVEVNWSGSATTQSPTPTITPSQTACPTPSPSPSGASPSPSATPCPTPSPTPSRTTTPSPIPTPSGSPTEEPRACGDGTGNTIAGTSGADVLIGTAGDDTICGFGGNDVIRGKGGNDVILAGGGDDLARGGRGADRVKGAGGDDELIGGAGSDVLKGGPGKDDLDGKGGNDSLDGGDGRDRCAGGLGRDRLRRCE